MLQIATFELPAQQAEANAFLRTHKPIGNIEFNKDMIFVGYEDGEYPVEYQIADLQEFVRGSAAARLQQEIALHVMEYEQADLKPGTPKWDEISMAIRNMKRGMDIQDVKVAFVEKRIQGLQSPNGSGKAKEKGKAK